MTKFVVILQLTVLSLRCKPPVLLGFLEWSMGFLYNSQLHMCLIFILLRNKQYKKTLLFYN